MTLPSRHRIRNSSPGGLRPSRLPLGHGGSPQYWLSHVDGETFLFLSNRRDRVIMYCSTLHGNLSSKSENLIRISNCKRWCHLFYRTIRLKWQVYIAITCSSVKRSYLLNLQVNRYRLLALQSCGTAVRIPPVKDLAVSSSTRPWIALYVLPEKINVFNMVVTKIDCAEHAGIELKCYWFYKIYYSRTSLKYDRPKKCPPILWGGSANGVCKRQTLEQCCFSVGSTS